MSRIQRIRSNSGFYHIMLRGNERKDIFRDDGDREYFLKKLSEKKQHREFYLHAYCLMDNHVHLMVSEGSEEISKIMKRINISYVQYFNRKYKRIGHLFQDRFKSECVEDDKYVLALIRYIHRNPVEAGLIRNIASYKWSSHNCYLHDGDNVIVDTAFVLELFSEEKEVAYKIYQEYMEQQSQDNFIDIDEKLAIDEEEGKSIFERMLSEQNAYLSAQPGPEISDDLIREYKRKTGLSIRKIAGIMNINKDRVNRALRDG